MSKALMLTDDRVSVVFTFTEVPVKDHDFVLVGPKRWMMETKSRVVTSPFSMFMLQFINVHYFIASNCSRHGSIGQVPMPAADGSGCTKWCVGVAQHGSFRPW